MKMSSKLMLAIVGVLIVAGVFAMYRSSSSSPSSPSEVSSTINSGLAPDGGGGITSARGGGYPPPPQSYAAAPDATSAPAAVAALVTSGSALDATSGGAPAAVQQQAQASDRLVVKTAFLSLQVENVIQAEAAVRAKVSSLNGYIVKVETQGTDDQMTSSVVFRVPQDRFDAALTGVEGMAKKVLGRTLGGDDVTEEFVDLDSRLRNLEATRDRLTTFLNKANKVEDALQVNQALTDVQGQIEQIQGRMKFLKQGAAMSTITVALQPVPTLPSIVQEEGWQPALVARHALRGLVEFGQGLAGLFIVLIIWSPVWLPLLLVGWWFVRRMRGGTTKIA